MMDPWPVPAMPRFRAWAAQQGLPGGRGMRACAHAAVCRRPGRDAAVAC